VRLLPLLCAALHARREKNDRNFLVAAKSAPAKGEIPCALAWKSCLIYKKVTQSPLTCAKRYARMIVEGHLRQGGKSMRTGKRRMVKIACHVLCGAILCGLLFWMFTRGALYEADGLHQHTRVEVQDVFVQDGVLYYTIENKSCTTISHFGGTRIDRRVGDTWEDANGDTIFGYGQTGWPVERFSHMDSDYILSEAERQPGEYRFFERFSLDGEYFYVVGYYTIE
jgi:hypothetical protein